MPERRNPFAILSRARRAVSGATSVAGRFGRRPTFVNTIQHQSLRRAGEFARRRAEQMGTSFYSTSAQIARTRRNMVTAEDDALRRLMLDESVIERSMFGEIVTERREEIREQAKLQKIIKEMLLSDRRLNPALVRQISAQVTVVLRGMINQGIIDKRTVAELFKKRGGPSSLEPIKQISYSLAGQLRNKEVVGAIRSRQLREIDLAYTVAEDVLRENELIE